MVQGDIVVQESEEVTAIVKEFYSDLYKLPSSINYVNKSQNNLNVNNAEQFTVDEIETAIRECNFNKPLGTDGFNGNLLEETEIKSNLV